MVIGDAVDVAILAGHERSARRGAEGVHYESVTETDAFGGDAIEMRGLEPREATFLSLFLLHDAQCVPALIVGEDVDKVGLTVGGGQGGESGEEKDKETGHAYLTTGPPRSCEKQPYRVTSVI
jgi:hypothetical protein